MSFKRIQPPRLPVPNGTVDLTFMTNLLRVLNVYFNQLSQAGQITLSVTSPGTANVIAALSFADPTITGPSLPTQADLANLRSGDVYYDTSANNVLKVKP